MTRVRSDGWGSPAIRGKAATGADGVVVLDDRSMPLVTTIA
ncbi:MAG: hypothetical protein QF614_05280 [SAR324 cluster bacterium]|nr:hypothetical protein [SAR324 cluster bacterium]